MLELESVAVHLHGHGLFRTAASHQRGQRLLEGVLALGERDSILRPARPGYTRHYRRKIELESIAEHRIRRLIRAKHPLLLGISLDQVDQIGIAPGELQIP